MKPRIAIPVPTAHDLAYNQRSWPSYADAVQQSGGDPVRVELSLSAAEIRDVVAACHGVCLPGSPADVLPALYGAEADPATSPADPARERLDSALLDEACASGKPVLAICFGMQFLNVYRGGTLVQDLTPLPVNHAAGGQVAVAHAALVAEHSLLASLLTPAEAPSSEGFFRLPINTSHHQSVATPGDGLKISARCPEDGVIEAIEADPGDSTAPSFLIGVQWHPERSFSISAASRALFSRLVDAARPFAAEAEKRTTVPDNKPVHSAAAGS